MSRTSSSSTSKTSSSTAKVKGTSAPPAEAQASAARPSWAPGANKRASTAAPSKGEGGGDDTHPWVALQAKDPRFALAVAESKHASPPEFYGDPRLASGS
jgi:hypothetical protein